MTNMTDLQNFIVMLDKQPVWALMNDVEPIEYDVTKDAFYDPETDGPSKENGVFVEFINDVYLRSKVRVGIQVCFTPEGEFCTMSPVVKRLTKKEYTFYKKQDDEEGEE